MTCSRVAAGGVTATAAAALEVRHPLMTEVALMCGVMVLQQAQQGGSDWPHQDGCHGARAADHRHVSGIECRGFRYIKD